MSAAIAAASPPAATAEVRRKLRRPPLPGRGGVALLGAGLLGVAIACRFGSVLVGAVGHRDQQGVVDNPTFSDKADVDMVASS